MYAIALFALLTPGLPAEEPAPVRVVAQEEGVDIWLSRNRDLEFGDRVRVYVRSEDDGHIVVLHADSEGRIRVLFPIDPFNDDFVRGGRDYEIRDRQDRAAVRMVEGVGFGMVYVAYSQDPFRYGEFSRGDRNVQLCQFERGRVYFSDKTELFSFDGESGNTPQQKLVVFDRRVLSFQAERS